MDSLLLLVRFFIGDAEPGIQVLNELYCAVLEGKKQKAEKTLPWHSGAAFRSFLGPISRNPFSDWNKRTKWQLVIDLVASSPRQKYLHTYNLYTMLYVSCTVFYYLRCLHFPSLFIAYIPSYLLIWLQKKEVCKQIWIH